jgi:predicted site-specific integrase-resolvase
MHETTQLPALLDQAAAAEYLGASPRTLERWRHTGTGPKFRKVGGLVRYMREDIAAFVVAAERQSTAQNSTAGR